MAKWLTRLLFDWVFVLLYKLFQAFLKLVDFIEAFFDIFAGTAKVIYKGDSEFLINIFFGHSSVVNAFWAMALIAIVLAFGFCVVQVSRKAVDVSGVVKQSVGQIMSGFFRCLLIIVLLNLITAAAINITNVLLDRVNYALKNAAVLNQEESDKTFSEQEYAAMTRILATVANYSVNPSADSRYNVNSCFNAIRPDLLSLYVNGFFRYDYPLDSNGHYTWQGALALLASSSDLTTDLSLDVYYADVVNAFQVVSKELNTYREFAPVERAHFSVPESIDTDVLIFLIAGMNAAQNSVYNGSDFNDALRKGYISGEKSYNNLTQVRKDFDIWEMDYLVGYIACLVFVVIMAICIFTFIVRMFNLLLLYLTSPLFVSSMPIDEGGKWQSWTQAFIIQLFSGFGMVIAMRLYLIIIPIIISSDLMFFENVYLNRMAQLMMVLGGAWAVLQAGSVITGILAGNPGMAAIQQEGRIGAMVTGWAMRAPRAALGTTKSLLEAPVKAGQGIKSLKGRVNAHHDQKSERMARKSLRQQNKADALFDKADQKIAAGQRGRDVQCALDRATKAQRQAGRTADALARRQAKYGQAAYQSKRNASGGYGSDSGSEFLGTPKTLGGPAPSTPYYVSPARRAAQEAAAKEAAAKAAGGGQTGEAPRASTAASGGSGPAPSGGGASASRARGAASGGSDSGGFTGTGRILGGAPPPAPSGGGASAPRARGAAPGGSDSSGSAGAGKTLGGGTPPPAPSGGGASAPRARGAAPGGSDSSGSAGTGKTLGGGGTPPPAPSGGGASAPRARGMAPGGSDSSGSAGAGRTLGGGTPPPAPSGGGASAPRARGAAPGGSDSSSFTGAGRTQGGGAPPPAPSGGGASAPRARGAAPGGSGSGGFSGGGRTLGGSTPGTPPGRIPPRRPAPPKQDGGDPPPPRK